LWDPPVGQFPHPHPVQVMLLAPMDQHGPPEPHHPISEGMQAVRVSWYRVIVEVTLYHRPQPAPDLGDRLMPAPPQFPFQLAELGGESLADSLALNDEPAGLSGLSAHVRKAQKVKHFRLALATLLAVFCGMTPELNQARLVRMEFQPELLQAVPPFRKEPLRVGTMLESHDRVSRPGESHPQALAEPYMNVSAHTAPVIQPSA